MARSYGDGGKDCWRRVPFMSALRRAGGAQAHNLMNTAWHNPRRGLWAMWRGASGANGAWTIFNGYPKAHFTGGGLDTRLVFAGFSQGKPRWEAGQMKLWWAAWPGGWVLKSGSGFPANYTDAEYDPVAEEYSTFESGDDWFFRRVATPALEMPFSHFSPDATAAFTGFGPHYGGETGSLTMEWPRLERSEGETAQGEPAESPAGLYDQALDGWTGPTTVRIGSPTFATAGADAAMSPDWRSCGDAVLCGDGKWRIGAETDDGAWLEAESDPREATAPGAIVRFTPQTGRSFDGEAPDPQVWTSRGLSVGERKVPVWVADVARFV